MQGDAAPCLLLGRGAAEASVQCDGRCSVWRAPALRSHARSVLAAPTLIQYLARLHPVCACLGACSHALVTNHRNVFLHPAVGRTCCNDVNLLRKVARHLAPLPDLGHCGATPQIPTGPTRLHIARRVSGRRITGKPANSLYMYNIQGYTLSYSVQPRKACRQPQRSTGTEMRLPILPVFSCTG